VSELDLVTVEPAKTPDPPKGKPNHVKPYPQLAPAPACSICQQTRDAMIDAGILKPVNTKTWPRGGASPQGPWVESEPTLRLDAPQTHRRG
jgi:hypothetical protein